MIIKFKRWHERREPLNQSWSDFQGTNTSLSVGQFEREITLRTPRVPASSYKRGSHVLEIQLIDERLLARQTETGMWEEALGVRVRTGRRRRWRRRRERREKKKAYMRPTSFIRAFTYSPACSYSSRAFLVPSCIMYDRTRWSRVPENHERTS